MNWIAVGVLAIGGLVCLWGLSMAMWLAVRFAFKENTG